MKRINVYAACDKAIQAMNRENVEAFWRLKTANFDRINIIRTVKEVYEKSAKRAQKRYYEVAFEAYLLAMALCRIEPKKAHAMAEKAITEEWVRKMLHDTDFMTLYRFDTEMERKAYKLAEALEVAQDKALEIDKALKLWSQQLGQYAINATDYALIDAFLDAKIEVVEWESEADERVCRECMSLDGKKFKIDELPVKPHPKCRCTWVPVLDDEVKE